MLGRWLLGSGAMPADLRSRAQAEGLLALEEELRGSLTLRDYRAPRRRYGWKRSAMRGGIALTTQAVVVWRRTTKLVDVPYSDPRAAEITWEADRPDRLLIRFDVARFRDEHSGTMEIRLRTERAAELSALIAERLR
jgi:hypothetical protein